MIHRVQKGETLSQIAGLYGVSPLKIAVDNQLTLRAKIVPGMELLVLMPGRTYTVKRGDTKKSIAEKFNISEKMLYRNNQDLKIEDKLYPGQILTVSCANPKSGAMVLNGYIYKGCSKQAFETALPRVTFMTFSALSTNGVDFTEEQDYSAFQSKAKSQGVLTLLRICLSAECDISVFWDETKRKQWIEKAVAYAKERHFDGITAAFYSFPTQNADSAFFKNFKEALIKAHLLFFHEIDGNEKAPITEYADATVLMYEKANSIRPPSFEGGENEVLRFYEKTGKASKIMLDISPFAYLNSVPIPKGKATSLAAKYSAEIVHDEETKLCSFSCAEGRGIFESLENTKAKFARLDELGFMGIAFDVMRTGGSLYMLAASEFAPVHYTFYSVIDGI